MVDCSYIVEHVCHIPHDHRNGDKSPMQLAEECGLFDHPDCVTPSAVEDYLRAHPELVDDWIMYSADKRSSPGYYLVDHGDELIVGFTEDGDTQSFTNRAAACAQYVTYEAKVLLAVAARNQSRSRLKPRHS